jgi:hypothetical protein
MLTMSSANVQIADNHYEANRAFESAQSGVEVARYWIERVYMPGSVSPANRFSNLASFVGNDLATVGIYATTTYDGSEPITVDLDNIGIDSSSGQSFSASIQKTGDPDVLQVDVTGTKGALTRTISVNYNYGVREESVFDYGVATRGSLHLSGNVDVDGTNVAVEAGVYIESNNDNDALSVIGNSQIAGDVIITNPDAQVTLDGANASIGGETGQDAIDNHVTAGAPPTEFPVPNTSYFEQYLGGEVVDSDTDTTSDAT